MNLNDFSTKREFGVIFQNLIGSDADIATDETRRKAPKRMSKSWHITLLIKSVDKQFLSRCMRNQPYRLAGGGLYG